MRFQEILLKPKFCQKFFRNTYRKKILIIRILRVVLLDENLLPATLDSLASVEKLNITMGFPLKNLAFSNAMKKLFHLHKQLEKKRFFIITMIFCRF